MNKEPKSIRIEDYNYELPEKCIARFALPQRDASKLLVWHKGKITDSIFSSLAAFLHAGQLMVSNNTRVIPARLIFRKPTGGVIEIFCLEPLDTTHQEAMTLRGSANWLCMVGGAKKWKGTDALQLQLEDDSRSYTVYAFNKGKSQDAHVIQFEWPQEFTFSELLDAAGKLPLPPYMQREALPEDYARYQTIFAQHRGSVAAPTAGLHFTDEVISKLAVAGVHRAEITLHVGAGTFRPVTANKMGDHLMHTETFLVSVATIENLIRHIESGIVAVGTTTMRTLESLYWLGIQAIHGELKPAKMTVSQWEPYEINTIHKPIIALEALLGFCRTNSLEELRGSTSIIIAPGYRFRICKGLITNFHMPGSTLLLLVAAMVGEKGWKEMYAHALSNNYRFLSYGDSCLLLPG